MLVNTAINFAKNIFNNMGNEHISSVDVERVLVQNERLFGRNIKEIRTLKNSVKALNFVQEAALSGRELDKDLILEIHTILMEGISKLAGTYRKSNVKDFACGVYDCRKIEKEFERFLKKYEEYSKKYTPIYLAAYAHLELIRIRPFNDGNCRVATLIMDFILLSNGINAITIDDENREIYYYFTKLYTKRKTLQPMVDLIESILRKDGKVNA